MKGTITLNIKSAGEISGIVNMVNVSPLDKVVLLHAFCSALNIENDDILAMIIARPMFDDGAEKTVVDMSALKMAANEEDAEDAEDA